MLQHSRTNGRRCLSAFVVAMFAVLLLASAARAEVLGGGAEGQEPGTGTATEPRQSGEGGSEGETQEAPQSPGEEEVAPEASGGGEATGETPVEPPVEPQPPSETAEATPPAPTETAETPVTIERGEETPIVLNQETVKSTESAEGGASAGAASHTSSLPPPVGTADSSARPAALEGPALTGPPATAATITAQLADVSGGTKGSTKANPTRSAGSQAGRFRCELSALGGKMTDNCTAGWLGAPREAGSTPTSAAISAVSSLAAAAVVDSPAGGGHGGSGPGGSPLTSAPGPAPGGSSGVATGAGSSGGSGTGVSIFITLAGLLLLGAPRALRRLQRAFEPWLAGCFVLIPERPD
jgi:hypothetical protein